MHHGFFITATDTGVGKTVFTAALAQRLREAGHDVVAIKAFATGAATRDGRRYSADAEFIERAAQSGEVPDVINPVLLDAPLAPAVAAHLEKRKLDVDAVLESCRQTCGRHEIALVEGVGGLLVPLTDEILVADFAARLALPLLIVLRPSLGTLNHTMLTVECAQTRGLNVAGIVVNGYPENPGLAERMNISEIKRMTGVPVLAILPHVSGIDTECGLRPNWQTILDAIDVGEFAGRV